MASFLLTGATGFIGGALLPRLQALGPVTPLGHRSLPPGGRRLDLADRAAVAALLDETRPDWIVHCAAMTKLAPCELDPTAAHGANVEATRNLVEWCRRERPDTRFLYLSTDQVYEGPGPSDEAAIGPLSVYARTKLWGEDLARQLARALVLRIGVFGRGDPAHPTFVDWIVENSLARRPITLFEDVLFNPLPLAELVELVVELIERELAGTFNLATSCDGLSKADFIRRLATCLDLPTEGHASGRQADVALPAHRSSDTRMRVDRLEAALGRPLPDFDQVFARFCEGLKAD